MAVEGDNCAEITRVYLLIPMPELFPPLPLLSTFLIASFVLAIVPGPAVAYIIARSAGQGRVAGFASVAGVALGNLGSMLGAAFGLAAVFAMSTVVFTFVKYLGAAYLIYLGIRAIRSPELPAGGGETGRVRATGLRRILLDGLLVALLNPKTALFFAAFLPQFLSGPAAPLQAVALGGLFVLIAATTDTLYVAVAATFWPRLQCKRDWTRAGRFVSGGVLIGLGFFAALGGERSRG